MRGRGNFLRLGIQAPEIHKFFRLAKCFSLQMWPGRTSSRTLLSRKAPRPVQRVSLELGLERLWAQSLPKRLEISLESERTWQGTKNATKSAKAGHVFGCQGSLEAGTKTAKAKAGVGSVRLSSL